MSSLSRDEVAHVAGLARIQLSDDELETFAGQLDSIVGFVASDPSFTGQPGVINGASELLGAAFGDAGVHARSAVGVAVLPLDAPVEVEITVAVADG